MQFILDTETEGMKSRRKVSAGKVFWGIVLIAGAAALLANQLGLLGDFNIWSVLFTVVLASIFVNGLVRRSFGQLLFSLAFMVIVNDKFLGLEAITPWPVLGAALLGTIGLNLIFPGFGRGRHLMKNGKRGVTCATETQNGDRVSYENTFGESVKYVVGEISGVRAENAFGTLQIFFSDAVLKEDRAYVHVESSFGSILLYVPSDWRVVMNLETSFGSATEKGSGSPASEKVLYVDGEVSFGGVEIIYI